MSITKLFDKRVKWGVLRHPKSGHILTDYQGRSYHCVHPFDEYESEPGVNYLVHDSLEIGDTERGQSAAGLRVQGKTQDYYMSVGNMAELLRAVADGRIGVHDGKFCGLFTFTKQGQNVSLTPAK